MQSTEKFYPLKGFEDYYEITKQGDVRRKFGTFNQNFNGGSYGATNRRNHILKGDIKKGYKSVFICIKGIVKKAMQVHRLVGLTFIENPENKLYINHINGIKNDNRVENLEWVTNSENQIHSYSVLGHKNPKATLLDEQVIDIYLNCVMGKNGNMSFFKSKYKITRNVIYGIMNSISYKNITKHLKRKGE